MNVAAAQRTHEMKISLDEEEGSAAEFLRRHFFHIIHSESMK